MAYRIGKKNLYGGKRITGRNMPDEVEAILIGGKPFMKCQHCGADTNLSDGTVDVINLKGKVRQKCSTCKYEYMVFTKTKLPIKSIMLREPKGCRITEEMKKEIIHSKLPVNELLLRYNISQGYYYKIIRER